MRIISFYILTVFCVVCQAKVFLPGMQPQEAGIEFAKVQQCMMCHANTKNGDADPFFSWRGGMMAQAARDPVFRAALTISNQDIEGVGEFCLRCHAPRGWLENRSEPADGSALNKEDMYGVSCDICHRFIDPVSEEAKKLVKYVPPGYGNAMMVADISNTVRGPYGDGLGAMPHKVMKSPFHASGQLCGTCHDISNPLYAEDVNSQAPYSFGHIERTYSEWELSDFAKRGNEGSCQACHYDIIEGGGQSSRFGSIQREYFVKHGPVGGSTWVQDATWLVWNGQDMDRKALDMGKQRSEKLLQNAAELKLSFDKPGFVSLRITNLSGHKLPSGYPEGRRMWINVKFFNSSGEVLGEIGKYGPKESVIFGEPVNAPTLLDAVATRVYECVPAMSEKQAKKYGKKPGKSFHFVLNDIIIKDNRIPPEGFKNSSFKEHLCEPIEATYEDGQYWDDIDFKLPSECSRVVVKLMYQSVSWEYIKFLAEENRTDDWGRRLYDAWNQTGKCSPTVMAEISSEIKD
ncbi:MAG: multiheme c-type cytochrome [Planctomycetota bacterium]|jgi:hypothetical protein